MRRSRSKISSCSRNKTKISVPEALWASALLHEVSVSLSVVSLQPHGLEPTRLLLCPRDLLDKNTGVGYMRQELYSKCLCQDQPFFLPLNRLLIVEELYTYLRLKADKLALSYLTRNQCCLPHLFYSLCIIKR